MALVVFSAPTAHSAPNGSKLIQSALDGASKSLGRAQRRGHHPKEIEALIRASARKYGLPEEKVVYIAWRESKFQPGARSPSGRYVGLYQFDLTTWRNTPEGRAGMRREDPVANINAAHWHMKTRGFGAWAVHTPRTRAPKRQRGTTALVGYSK